MPETAMAHKNKTQKYPVDRTCHISAGPELPHPQKINALPKNKY